MGFALEDIQNPGERHIRALVEDWEKCKLAEKTMQNQLSRLRRVAAWIGKPILIPRGKGVWALLPGVAERKVVSVAQQSKSWSESGTDMVAKIREADAIDERMGIMLCKGVAFGLRRKEQLMGKLWALHGGGELLVNSNIAKHGRDRRIEIHHGFQRGGLDYAKRLCKKGEFMGWPGASYEQTSTGTNT